MYQNGYNMNGELKKKKKWSSLAKYSKKKIGQNGSDHRH